MKRWLAAAVAIVATAITIGAFAQNLSLPIPSLPGPLPPDPAKTLWGGAVFNKPVYNPETKSYFEYYFPSPGLLYNSELQFGWETSKRMAEERVFHGVRGRLAVIKDKETNDFIVKALKPQDGAWIGLEYMCDLRALRWVTGEFWPLTAYQNWSQPWNVGLTTPVKAPSERQRAWCLSDQRWMGVHYWGPKGNFKWNANGTAKQFGWMIIEFPTGKP